MFLGEFDNNKRATVLKTTIALLLFCIMFMSFQVFVEAEILSKWYAFLGGSIIYGIVTLLIIKKPEIRIDTIAISVSALVGYLLLRSLLSSLIPTNIYILSLVSFLLLYFFFKLTSSGCLQDIGTIILCVCIAQACYGLMQYVGIFHTYKAFKMTGSFDNPAGFSGCLSAGFPFSLYLAYKAGWKKYLGFIALLIIASSIILSGSRAGVIAISVVSLVYLGNRYRRSFRKHRKYFILAIIVICIAGAGLFFLKKDSALGRVLIWENSCDMVKKNPLFGSGTGYFIGNYMQYQANYFEQNPDSKYSQLADNVTHPFNEYMLLTIEYGIFGLLLLLVIIFLIIKYSKQITVYYLCLLAIGIFACFSYPLRYPFITVVIAYCLANIKSGNIIILSINTLVKVVVVILTVFISIPLLKDIQFEKRWGQMVQKSQLGTTEPLLDNYNKLYSMWNGDPMFLYNYGAVLNKARQYEMSNEILIECTKYLNNYHAHMLIADNFFKSGQLNIAEIYYRNANNMIPTRFMPLYRLMLLYGMIEDKAQQLKMANIIINKIVKVSSGTIKQIKKEAKCIIDLNEYSAVENNQAAR